jgi:acetyl-CoA C-acetyltransferase
MEIEMRNVVIVSASRTAVGNFGGSLKDIPVVELGATVLKDTLKKVDLRPEATELQRQLAPDSMKDTARIDLEQKGYDYDQSSQPIGVDEVIMGNVVSAAQGQNVARQAMMYAGLAKETPAFTINKVCASGMKALALAAQSIRVGDADVILAGGMENMSRIPYAMTKARWGARMGDAELTDLVVWDGLHEIFYGYHMGITAENIAEKYDISRNEQDALGALSHQRARDGISQGKFKEEVIPISIPQRKGDPIIFENDERPMDTSIEKMAKLRPAFKKDGTVTAGNASGINDGAAALLLMSENKAAELGLKPLVKIRASTSGGLDPAYMGLGPVPAIRKILKQENLSIDDFGTIELNEAFAAQAIGCIRELNCNMESTNKLGSGISIGHPIGCSGARILVTLVHTMLRDGDDLGLASLCIGGGQGMAVVLEQV